MGVVTRFKGIDVDESTCIRSAQATKRNKVIEQLQKEETREDKSLTTRSKKDTRTHLRVEAVAVAGAAAHVKLQFHQSTTPSFTCEVRSMRSHPLASVEASPRKATREGLQSGLPAFYRRVRILATPVNMDTRHTIRSCEVARRDPPAGQD